MKKYQAKIYVKVGTQREKDSTKASIASKICTNLASSRSKRERRHSSEAAGDEEPNREPLFH